MHKSSKQRHPLFFKVLDALQSFSYRSETGMLQSHICV